MGFESCGLSQHLNSAFLHERHVPWGHEEDEDLPGDEERRPEGTPEMRHSVSRSKAKAP